MTAHRTVWLGFPPPLGPDRRLVFRRARRRIDVVVAVGWGLAETWRALHRATRVGPGRSRLR
ncbi:MAG TPA: hypothetical protein VLN26_02090 [Gaiellaceae bacterium]|nr:hypothetical protein [Gaiellaceae bacterium]